MRVAANKSSAKLLQALSTLLILAYLPMLRNDIYGQENTAIRTHERKQIQADGQADKKHEASLDVRLFSADISYQYKITTRLSAGIGIGGGWGYMFFTPSVREGYVNKSDTIELYQGSIFSGMQVTNWLRIELGFRISRTDTLNICYNACLPSQPDGLYKGGLLNVLFFTQEKYAFGLTILYGLFTQENGYHLVVENQGVSYERFGIAIMPLMRFVQYF